MNGVFFGGYLLESFSITYEELSIAFHNFMQAIYMYDKKYWSQDTTLWNST